MHREPSEVRDFLPDLAHRLAPLAGEIVIEEGIGSGMGLETRQYVQGHGNIRIGGNQECCDQDIVVQIRSPAKEKLARMKRGTILFSMLHYPTHPGRIEVMAELGLRPISMDSVVDDQGRRLIENLCGTSWNAVRAGFRALRQTYPALEERDRKPLEVVILGTGPMGRFAADAAVKYGDVTLQKALLSAGVPGVVAHLIGRNITQDETALKELFERADMLVDATSRTDPTQHIIANHLIGALPEHAVVLDITADPYDTDRKPIQVKAIEGIPTGDLDQFEFPPDDPAFDQLPNGVRSEHRRMTVSCYSWPGVDPKPCMEIYGGQVLEFLKVLLEQSYESLSIEHPNVFVRALCRSTLEYWAHHQKTRKNAAPAPA